MNRQVKFVCPKCGSSDSDNFKIRTTGGLFSSIMNIQHKKFNAVVCSNCQYSELYYVPSGRRREL